MQSPVGVALLEDHIARPETRGHESFVELLQIGRVPATEQRHVPQKIYVIHGESRPGTWAMIVRIRTRVPVDFPGPGKGTAGALLIHNVPRRGASWMVCCGL